MIVYPHAKINLGLQVKEKRSDAFHEIETLFYPVDLCDILEIKPAESPQLFLYGLPINGLPNENLCMKAYGMLRNDYHLPPVQFHLYKKIPVGGGLGGGSSDGAYTLKLLNDYFSLGITDLQLEEYASRLGSDCPCMLYKRPSLASGRGERLTPFQIDLSGFYIVVCKPDIFISTAYAYTKVKPKKPEYSLEKVLAQPLTEWKGCLVNDFEEVLFPEFPVLKEYKDKLYEFGAVYASLSGSGSALYGIFKSRAKYYRASAYFSEKLALFW
jgi:4-diphosphocytidyl-2-C-methyl-D-erythritol kinase